ncbi:hypothetical protein, partial [Escherichia coli]|uniref:hypothetical protein n=1 Tax=Escherichia coli TaxID=562 RepID=UPI001BD3EB59
SFGSAVTVAGRVREGVLPKISRHNRKQAEGNQLLPSAFFLKIFLHLLIIITTFHLYFSSS